ncbi:ATP-dependent DNA helicase [Nymphaea thermarum]|nr:ATP-dependent DNA helicase [Nymphaea thermarum]
MASLGTTLLPLSLSRSRSDPSPSFCFGLSFSLALRKALERECCARCRRRPLSSRVRAVVTQGIPVARTVKANGREKISDEHDEISILHEKIRRESSGKREGPQTTMASAEADKYIQMVKMQQQRGLRKLKGEKEGTGEGFSYKVDPYTLRPGDYVVHKKVGIGRFVGTRFDVRTGSTEPVECVFIEYADGMAKLPVKQAARMLYRYSLPNETKKPRALSKLSDPSAWEKRRIKGKFAVQKMIVDLMELYLHRLKQKRPPYPKTPAVDEFAAQFPYKPTPDQEQTKAEKEEYLAMIRQGLLDIIVGTHALLGTRVVYNNLGLLVVDEEQRFGVKQKERIASFKTSVDVLTLSATPIPRTLYLALTGFRDASLIATPPPERVPIKTHLSPFSEEKVLSAINFELARGGQVFYVLPRIKGLEDVVDFLEQSFPDVPIAIAHGKQYSKLLEDTMEKFALGETKILVCTNIVESGLDIQNANTIIVQDVHKFGLAQLYQLRGRVGRADKEAHAYLFYPDKATLSDQALERLAALEECRDLGQGFNLAERDMAIRGFGNIFGEQQTGDVGNVGIDLFFEMLFESLSKVDEHRLVPVNYKSVQLDIDIRPQLSSEYINRLENPVELINEAEKAAGKDIWSLMQFTEQLRRQYGKEPRSMEMLLKKLYVRRMAADLGISKIYTFGKMVGMRTSMSKRVFRLIVESMPTDIFRNSLVFEDNQIKAELLLELPSEQLLNWIFQCLAEFYDAMPALIKCDTCGLANCRYYLAGPTLGKVGTDPT